MPRDYKKEWLKEKESKVTRLIKIDKTLFNEFTAKLKEDNETINGFFNEQIKIYLNKR